MIKKIILIFFALIITVYGLFYINSHKKTDDKKKLVFWTIQLKPIYEKQLNKIISNFESKHPDYKVVWVDIPIQEAQKRTLASILSSTPPDLINLNPDFSVILAQKNALEFFDENETEQFHKNLVNKLRFNGKTYALPFYATSPVTIYNKEIYDKCINKNFIKTYDDLFSISNQLRTCSNIAPYAASLNENDTLARILNKYDITLNTIQKENKKETAYKVFMAFNEMYKNNELPKDVLTINHREVVEKYMSNQALIIVAGSNFINMIKQNAPDVYKKSAISNQLTGKNQKYDVSLMNLIIPKKSKNKELAKELALELTNKENQLELTKLTNVLSANKYALMDDYFKNCPSDLVEKSRCVSVRQLDNLIESDFGDKNKKTINESINRALEETLLDDKNSCPELVRARINHLFLQLNSLIFEN